jgi:hypothetical protein
MPDFFAGVYGARFPDVVINGGGQPLPGMGGLPTPLHDTPDGKINYNSSLLGDLEPYAYGEPGYQSSQTAYLNIPHKVQKIVPFLYLPEPDRVDSFRLNHPIDDGDIAFAMRLDRNSEVCTGLNNKSLHRAGLGTAIDPMINLCTLNYLLAGIQICTQVPALRVKWDQLLHYLDGRRFEGHVAGRVHAYSYDDLKHVVRNLIRPFGIAHGSERQGGQHEGSNSPVTWPVSFVISLTLDGKEANMVNVWHKHDIVAGQDLVLRLKAMPLPPNKRYTLNHYPKGLVEKTFSDNLLEQALVQGQRITHVWQLVPDTFDFDVDAGIPVGAVMAPAFKPAPGAPDPCWQQEGYWHVARAQIHCQMYGKEDFYYNDLANNLRTGHMDVTFQPTYFAVPYRDVRAQGGDAVPQRRRGPGAAPTNVFNVLGEQGGKRGWQGALRIEQRLDSDAGADVEMQDGEGGWQRRGRQATRVTFAHMVLPSDDPAEISAEPPPSDAGGSWMGGAMPRIAGLEVLSDAPPPAAGSAGMSVDIGVFDFAPEAGGGPARSGLQIPTPGLKAARRPAARGKGVVGAVLASDGSVTHEPSRIL